MPGAQNVAAVYDRLGAGYDQFSALLDRTAVHRLRNELLARATGTVLEVAVGTGANLRRYPPGVRVIGLDFSATSLAAATRRADTAGLGWSPLLGNAQALPLATGSIDTVVCTLAGCTFADPGAAFAEMRRVVKRDGRALFVEHVRPANRPGAALMRAITPLTTAALGCHPDRDTVTTISSSGFVTRVLDRAVGGLFVAVEATPA